MVRDRSIGLGEAVNKLAKAGIAELNVWQRTLALSQAWAVQR